MHGDRYDSLMDVLGHRRPFIRDTVARQHGARSWRGPRLGSSLSVQRPVPLQVRSQISLVTTTGLLVGHRS